MYHLTFYCQPRLQVRGVANFTLRIFFLFLFFPVLTFLQRYVLRLLFMVPVYGLLSAMSSKIGQPWAAYFETGRDCYEVRRTHPPLP